MSDYLNFTFQYNPTKMNYAIACQFLRPYKGATGNEAISLAGSKRVVDGFLNRHEVTVSEWLHKP
jgi:hypothetical protein